MNDSATALAARPEAAKAAKAKKRTTSKAKKSKLVTKTYEGPTRKERIEATHELLLKQLKTMVSGDDWKAFLGLSAKFHRYSANNCLLIALQRPEATRVASFRTWKSLGRYVKKGEKGISIFAPCLKKLEDDCDDETWLMRGYRIVSVFDVSQTDGDPIDDGSLTTLLEGQAPEGMWDAISGLIEENGFSVSYGDTGRANGYTSHTTKQVVVSPELSEAAAAKTLVHELTHVLQSTEHRAGLSKEVIEVEAESTAFVVCQALGLESAPYSIGYVAGWSGGDTDVVRNCADWVIKTAHTILAAVMPEEDVMDVEDEVVVSA